MADDLNNSRQFGQPAVIGLFACRTDRENAANEADFQTHRIHMLIVERVEMHGDFSAAHCTLNLVRVCHTRKRMLTQ